MEHLWTTYEPPMDPRLDHLWTPRLDHLWTTYGPPMDPRLDRLWTSSLCATRVDPLSLILSAASQGAARRGRAHRRTGPRPGAPHPLDPSLDPSGPPIPARGHMATTITRTHTYTHTYTYVRTHIAFLTVL
jgi:hypothetical protein